MTVGWLAVDGDMVVGGGTAAATSLFGGCWRESKTQLWICLGRYVIIANAEKI